LFGIAWKTDASTEISIAPVKLAEFVVFRLAQFTAELQFLCLSTPLRLVDMGVSVFCESRRIWAGGGVGSDMGLQQRPLHDSGFGRGSA